MKKLLTLFCVGVFGSALCVAFMACNEPKEPEIQGVDMPFIEYFFKEGVPGDEVSAKWVNLDYYDEFIDRGKILVIDSDGELKKYVEGDYPAVDFSKKTLVLAYGRNSGPGFGFDVKFQQISDLNYVMTAHTWASGLHNISKWQIAIIVDKLPSESKIQFNGVLL